MQSLKYLSIKEKKIRTKQEHRREAYKIIRRHKIYDRDHNYMTFVTTVLDGLLDSVDSVFINEIIKTMQRKKQKKSLEDKETWE